MLRGFTQPPYKNLSLAIIIIIGGVEPWPAKSPVGHCVWSQNMTCSSANLVSNHKSAQKDSFISSQSGKLLLLAWSFRRVATVQI